MKLTKGPKIWQTKKIECATIGNHSFDWVNRQQTRKKNEKAGNKIDKVSLAGLSVPNEQRQIYLHFIDVCCKNWIDIIFLFHEMLHLSA